MSENKTEFTLIYGMRLYHGSSTDLDRIEPMRTTVDGSTEVRVTPHLIEGATREEIKRQLLLSVDAFFDLH